MRFYTDQHQYYCLPDVRQAGRPIPKVQRTPSEDPFGIYQKYVCLYPRSSRKYSAAQKLSCNTTSLIANYRTIPAGYRHHGGIHVHLVPI